MRPEDREKFVKLATKRVNSALKSLQLVGNLSNKSNYSYTDEDISKIFRALQGGLNACKKRFDMASKPTEKDVFRLD